MLPKEKIRPFQILDDIKGYSKRKFLADLAAAVTVSLFSAPQAMADALVAGLPPEMGIAAIIISGALIALFGASNHLAGGPTNAIAILIGGALTQTLMLHFPDMSVGMMPEAKNLLITTAAIELTLMVGILQLLGIFFQFGQLIRFIGRPVILGYLVGVVLNIVVNQCYNFFGLYTPRTILPLYARAWDLVTSLGNLDPLITAIGMISICSFILFRFILKRPSYAAFGILSISAALVYLIENHLVFGIPNMSLWLDLDSPIRCIGDLGNTANLLPHFSFPHFDFALLYTLFPVACTIAVFSVLETSMVSRSIASKTGQVISTSQEIFALGAGNLIGSFFGAMASSGSASRTNLNYDSGAQTRLACLYAALLVALLVALFSPFVAYIPLSALAVLILTTSIRLINFKEIHRCLVVTRSDALVFGVTAFVSLFLSLDTAFYFGCVLSIILYLQQASRPKMNVYAISYFEGPRLLPSVDLDPEDTPDPIYLLHIEGELFFAAAEMFKTILREIASHTEVKVIILNMQNARDLDITSCQALEQIIYQLRCSSRHIILCGVRSYFYEVMSNYGLVELMGEEYLFRMNKLQPETSLKYAIDRARELLISNQAPPVPVLNI